MKSAGARAVVVVLVGFAAGFLVRHWLLADDGHAAPAASSTVPTLFFSSRLRANAAPRASGEPAGTTPLTDGRERLAGAQRYAPIRAQCGDDAKCQYSQCSRACSEWIASSYTPGEVKGLRAQQEIFIQCVGYCLHPAEFAERVGVSPAPSGSARRGP